MPTRISLFAKLLTLLGLAGFALAAHAAAPSGNDWYQILANPFTGGDNTGDGGTGNPADLNYYYVGQAFTGTMQINVDTLPGSNASNIWIDYPTTIVTSTNLTVGSFFSSWSGQVVSSTIGRIYSTGFRTLGYSSGQGSFGAVTINTRQPSAANYGIGSPATLHINTGVIGATTESNISFDGDDILDSAEDFQFHVWADTKKPYAKDPNPANLATSVTIDTDFLFDLRDSKNGEGDDSGVGTGVNTAEPPGVITTDDGGGAADVTPYDAFSCSGIWGTNLCHVTVDPPSPSAIPGDTRNWNYSTTYTVLINSFKDLASNSQNQLGDANGPNTMDPKSYTFTTEADIVAPRVTAETPVRSTSGNAPSSNIIIDIQDRKTYPNGPSGTGVDPATCHFNISSASFPLVTYQQGSVGVTVTPIAYGYRYTINPATDFGQSETVSVSAYDCEDIVNNLMTTDNWTFSTSDGDAPYVTNESPSNDQTSALNQNVTFHIKDDASGVDLANTVIFLNGVYYTNAGGAGSVTNVGTKINFASSLNFNGSNYVGDTTSRTGTVNDEIFTLNPQADFTEGEAVPVIIYTRDISGNLMERVVFAFIATGVSGSCPSASSFCGAGTTFNGSQCIGSGSGGTCSTSGSGGSSPARLEINEPTVTVTPLDDTTVLITWLTSLPATTAFAYDNHGSIRGEAPYFDYRFSVTESKAVSLYHAVKIGGLIPGAVYFFKPGGNFEGTYTSGIERLMATPFQTVIVPGPTSILNAPALICPKPVVIPVPSRPSVQPPIRPTPSAPGTNPTPVNTPTPSAPIRKGPALTKVTREGAHLIFFGLNEPESGVTIIVY